MRLFSSKVIGGENDIEISSYDITVAFKAMYRILKHLLARRPMKPDAGTFRVYCQLTGNDLALDSFYGDEDAYVVRYDAELTQFIRTRTVRMMKKALHLLPKPSLDYLEELAKTKSEPGTIFNLAKELVPFHGSSSTTRVRVIDNGPEMLNKLKMLEYRIKGMFRLPTGLPAVTSPYGGNYRPDHMSTSSPNRMINEPTLEDPLPVLAALVDNFFLCMDNSEESFRCKLYLMYLISMIMIGMADEGYRYREVQIDDDYNDDEMYHDRNHLYHNYMTLSTVGTYSIPNMICCFNHENLLSFALESRNKLSSVGKDMLRNMLAVQSQTKGVKRC